jgi:hypothetical protein
MAVISGAKTLDEVTRTVKAGFFSVIRVGCHDSGDGYNFIKLSMT